MYVYMCVRTRIYIYVSCEDIFYHDEFVSSSLQFLSFFNAALFPCCSLLCE